MLAKFSYFLQQIHFLEK